MNPRFLGRYIYRPDAALLFEPTSGLRHALDPVANEMVRHLSGGLEVADVAERMSGAYGVPAEDIAVDIHDLLHELAMADHADVGDDPEKDLDQAPGFPFAIELELTRLCNWACSFCYNVWKSKKPGQRPASTIHMPVDLACGLLDDAARSGLLRARFSGGEPTMHPQFERILAHGAAAGLYQVVFTNGRTLDEATARRWRDWNVREVMISLHGGEASHDSLVRHPGAWRHTLAAISAALKAGLDVVVEMTVTAANARELLPTMRVVAALGVKEFRAMRYVPTGRQDSDLMPPGDFIAQTIATLERLQDPALPRLLFPCSPRFCLTDPQTPLHDQALVALREKYLVRHCAAGLNWVSVSHEGKARVCPHSNQMLGDLSSTPLAEVWPRMQSAVLAALAQHSAACDSCAAFKACRAGCHLDHFTEKTTSC